MSEAIARLDKKTGYRVLCGVLDCGADVASVVLVSPINLRVACFDPGWQRRQLDGIWELSRHAKANLQRYRRRQRRREPCSVCRGEGITIVGKAGCRHDLGSPPLLARRPTSLGKETQSLVHALKRPQLPARAKCKACGFINVLEADRLRSIDPRSPLQWCEIIEPYRWAEW